MSNKLAQSVKHSNKGRIAGSKNFATQRKFVYFSEVASKVNFCPVSEIKKAVEERNHEMVRALTPLLRYMAPEFAPVTIEGTEPEKDDINLNISLNGLVMNEQNSND